MNQQGKVATKITMIRMTDDERNHCRIMAANLQVNGGITSYVRRLISMDMRKRKGASKP